MLSFGYMCTEQKKLLNVKEKDSMYETEWGEEGSIPFCPRVSTDAEEVGDQERFKLGSRVSDLPAYCPVCHALWYFRLPRSSCLLLILFRLV